MAREATLALASGVRATGEKIARLPDVRRTIWMQVSVMVVLNRGASQVLLCYERMGIMEVGNFICKCKETSELKGCK